MIRITCPGCKVKLNAKEELAGQSRKCPKCGAVIQIPGAAPEAHEASAVAEADADEWGGLDEVAPDQHVHGTTEAQLPSISAPERLVRQNKYAICDKAHLVALWEGNGQGWMLKTNTGLVKVSRNADQLPSQGVFTLVELAMAMTDEGLRLQGIECFQLAERWALTALDQDEHKILSRITGPGHLTRDQKSVVHHFLREQFMRDVWQDAREVLDFLSNLESPASGAD